MPLLPLLIFPCVLIYYITESLCRQQYFFCCFENVTLPHDISSAFHLFHNNLQEIKIFLRKKLEKTEKKRYNIYVRVWLRTPRRFVKIARETARTPHPHSESLKIVRS
jgi:hypothetical protein